MTIAMKIPAKHYEGNRPCIGPKAMAELRKRCMIQKGPIFAIIPEPENSYDMQIRINNLKSIDILKTR